LIQVRVSGITTINFTRLSQSSPIITSIENEGDKDMEEYIEDILEDKESAIEFLEALDLDRDFLEVEWQEMLEDDDYLFQH